MPMKFKLDRLSRTYLKEDRQLFEGVERDRLYNLIFNPNNWEINKYDSFLNSLAKTPQKYRGFMADHPMREISRPEWKTFKLKDFDAGFALHYAGKGKVDICNLHNNSSLKGISDLMLTFAKRQGGTMLDNYAGFLGNKYQKNGFDKYETYTWSDEYRPKGWREDLFGTPDVEMRTYTSHDKKYNSKKGYKNHFDKKMDKAFPGHNISESRLKQIIRESIKKVLG